MRAAPTCIQLRILCEDAIVRHSVVQAGPEPPHLCLLAHQPDGGQLEQGRERTEEVEQAA